MYVDILFLLTKAIAIMFERFMTQYQTLHTWIGHNSVCYHNFNTLPHTLPYIFSQFSMVLGIFTTGYNALPSNLWKNIY